MGTNSNLQQELRQAALEYHEFPQPGKLAIVATKHLSNQRDLALAYSPGVAAACEEIVTNPLNAMRYTARGNLVAVITNGTAVLGLGAIGPLAAKPVMEGKAVLFKKFAGIDVFDLEINETDPDKLCQIIASLEPTFGAINLEDIKAPECFYIERKLRQMMKIPVFHDDQHGTAIIVGAALLNALHVVQKSLKSSKLVVSGAGAAALACLDLLVDLGFAQENIYVTDLAGVVYQGRTELMDEDKLRFAQATDARTLDDLMVDADIFLGLSAGGVLKPAMVKKMAQRPIIFALANPNPEILPEDVYSVRQDAIIATGRSDYPNQVNNVLCFPFIFRGALDSGATMITRAMEIAAVHAIADLAKAEQSEEVSTAYGLRDLSFGPEYLIPKPFDLRLMGRIAPAVAQAAMDDGVATTPIKDFESYQARLQQMVYHSGTFMKPIFQMAKSMAKKRIAFAEGEDERVLRAAQVLVDEGIAFPVLIGRPAVIEKRIKRYGLRLKLGVEVQNVNPEQDERYRDYVETYFQMTRRKGVTLHYAKIEMRRRLTLIGTMLLHKGDVDGLICGTFGNVHSHLKYIDEVIGKRAGVNTYAAMNILVLNERNLAIVDTHINYDPSSQQIAEMTTMAAQEMKKIGIQPRVALLSHSNFGSSEAHSALKMREALAILQSQKNDFELDGEMHGDCALDSKLRKEMMADSPLSGDANLLVLPNIDAANISYNLLKTAAGQNVAVGPILLGCAKPVHILTASATVRRIVNVTTLCVVDANKAK